MNGSVAMLTAPEHAASAAPGAKAGDRMRRADAPVLIMAGGTGGHIFPGIAVAQELRDRGVPVVWLGSEGGLETRLVPQAGIEIETIPISGVRGKGVITLLAAPLRIARALWTAWRLLGRVRPRTAIAFGGFASGPGGMAAWLRRVPLIVHEQNRIPGTTNRILSHFAKRRLCGFADAFAGGEWLGNPVRAAIAALAPPQERYVERRDNLRLLVLGGSQGAYGINVVLPQVLQRLPAGVTLQVRHQSGPKHYEKTSGLYEAAGSKAQVLPFIEDMAAAYAWADLVVCRAGATTIAELCAAGLPAVLVPFPQAVDDHQTRNATALVDAGAARLVAEGDGFADRLVAALTGLCAGGTVVARAHLVVMAEAARTLAKPDAAERIAAACLAEAAA